MVWHGASLHRMLGLDPGVECCGGATRGSLNQSMGNGGTVSVAGAVNYRCTPNERKLASLWCYRNREEIC